MPSTRMLHGEVLATRLTLTLGKTYNQNQNSLERASTGSIWIRFTCLLGWQLSFYHKSIVHNFCISARALYNNKANCITLRRATFHKLVEPIYVSIAMKLSRSMWQQYVRAISYESIPNCSLRTNSFIWDVPPKHTLKPRQYSVTQ